VNNITILIHALKFQTFNSVYKLFLLTNFFEINFMSVLNVENSRDVLCEEKQWTEWGTAYLMNYHCIITVTIKNKKLELNITTVTEQRL